MVRQNGWNPKISWHQHFQKSDPRISTEFLSKINEIVQTWNPRIEKQNQRKHHAKVCGQKKRFEIVSSSDCMQNRTSGMKSRQPPWITRRAANRRRSKKVLRTIEEKHMKTILNNFQWMWLTNAHGNQTSHDTKIVKQFAHNSTNRLHKTKETVKVGNLRVDKENQRKKWCRTAPSKLMFENVSSSNTWGTEFPEHNPGTPLGHPSGT